MRQNILIFAGIVAFLFGLLFLLQGLGVVRAPADSFMIDNRDWVLRGGVIMALGALLAAGARIVPAKRGNDEGAGVD